MSDKKTFHWRDIRTSQHLQHVAEILKDADRPLSGLDVQDEAVRRGFRIVNPGTDIGEIGRNPGYTTSGGVRFPDRKYRYWLTAAPGWTPRWRVNKEYQVVPWDSPLQTSPWQAGDLGGVPQSVGASEEESEAEAMICPQCGEETDGGFCNDKCKKKFFERR